MALRKIPRNSERPPGFLRHRYLGDTAGLRQFATVVLARQSNERSDGGLTTPTGFPRPRPTWHLERVSAHRPQWSHGLCCSDGLLGRTVEERSTLGISGDIVWLRGSSIMEERFLTGRIVDLQIFLVSQFGTRASFRLEYPGTGLRRLLPCR